MSRRFLHRKGNDEETSGTMFRDYLALMMAAFAMLTVLLMVLPHKPDDSAQDASRARGNLRAEIIWDNKADVDIDLWTKAPGLAPIGYSNMSGPVLNLVRDDLGNYADITGINYETSFSRGLPEGEWIINIHWFGNISKMKQVKVKVLVTIRQDDSSNSKQAPEPVIQTEVVLTNVGQELTVIRFKLDGAGKLIPSSMNSIPKMIRSGVSSDDS